MVLAGWLGLSSTLFSILSLAIRIFSRRILVSDGPGTRWAHYAAGWAGKANKKVRAWASSEPVATIFLSVITILEIEAGALLIERRHEAQGKMLRAWIDRQVLPRFEGRILPVDAAVAQRSARLHVPDPRSERDALIAATALVHGLTVVPRNLADFEPTGVRTLNPWQ